MDGSVVILTSRASGKSLRSYRGTAEGVGGTGAHGKIAYCSRLLGFPFSTHNYVGYNLQLLQVLPREPAWKLAILSVSPLLHSPPASFLSPLSVFLPHLSLPSLSSLPRFLPLSVCSSVEGSCAQAWGHCSTEYPHI